MAETLIIWTIIAISVFFTGRMFYRQWTSATSDDPTVTCGGCCSSCNLGSHCKDIVCKTGAIEEYNTPETDTK